MPMPLTPTLAPARAVALVLLLAGAAAPAHAITRVPNPDSGLVATPAPWPRFALFGWQSPPLAQTDTYHYAELANAGFNLTVLAPDDSGAVSDNLARLDASRPNGVRNLLLDGRLDSIRVAGPAGIAFADTIANTYEHDPAFLGYYLGDEPDTSTFAQLGVWYFVLRVADHVHPAWNNLRPLGYYAGSTGALDSYVRQFVSATHPSVLCNSQYDFSWGGDANLIVLNIATLAAIARENNLPFWGVVQYTEHGWFRHVTDGMLRWQMAQWVAWGARGIGVFTYWTPAPDPYYDWQPAMIAWGTGLRTANYDTVRTIDAHLAPIGNTLAGMTWLGVEYSGSTPPGGPAFAPDTLLAAVEGRAMIGEYRDSLGVPCVFVANSDSLSARSITLTLAPGRGAARLADDGSAWEPAVVDSQGSITLGFAPGDFTLLRLGAPLPPSAGVGPPGTTGAALRLGANPGRGALRFSTQLPRRGRLSLLDASGRLVWTHDVPPGAFTLSWSGERSGGGAAPPGLYFVRLESPDGRAVRRADWLGAR